MAENKRIVVIGGGIFGLTTATLLGQRGHDVVVLEKHCDVMQGASQVNQNRIHLGYHYPRSVATARESLRGIVSFRETYGDAIVSNFAKYYAIARNDSKTTPEGFEAFCREVPLELVPEWPSEAVLDRSAVAACWRVPEVIFDYHILRRLVLSRVAALPSVRIQRNVWPMAVEPGAPHRVTLSDGTTIEADSLVNATYAGLSDVVELLGATPPVCQYELCVMPILEMADPPPRIGVTVMDGPFCSLMPKGNEPGKFLLYHVSHSVLETEIGRKLPRWKPIRGLPELELKEACRRFFPIVEKMEWRESWISPRVVLPSTERDDARPTLLIEHGPQLFSVFSGKLTTCVEVARSAVAAVEGKSHSQDRMD